jgi:hypothetical protein
MKILNKAKMYELLEKGLLGNHLRIFRTDEELREGGVGESIGVRCVGAPGGAFYYSKSVKDAIRLANMLRVRGITVVYQVSAPDHLRTIQGEVCYAEGLLCLTYSTAKAHMREALKTAKTVFGYEARAILNAYVDPSSMDDIELVLDTYKDHVVEFTSFSCCVGGLKGRNTCIWECRCY